MQRNQSAARTVKASDRQMNLTTTISAGSIGQHYLVQNVQQTDHGFDSAQQRHILKGHAMIDDRISSQLNQWQKKMRQPIERRGEQRG